ncbi:hypothetical protein EON80_22675 [bacterium]|nr:MAG: hypothetical protein EON80_22675 [bacterium]
MPPETLPASEPHSGDPQQGESQQGLGRTIYNLFAPKGDFVGQAFRLEFTPFALSQSVTGVIPLTLFALKGPAQFRIYAVMLLAFKISIGAVLTAAIVTRFFPVMVNDRALRARNFWGMARVIPFEEIAKVEPIRWLIFTPFARISTHRYKNWVWLPLFLVRQQEFEKRYCEVAPVDNPLRVYFES